MDNTKTGNKTFSKEPREPKEFAETTIQVNRVSKKITGGSKVGYSVLVAVGNQKGQIGVALAKSPEVSLAVAKAVTRAKRAIFTVPMKNNTIPGVVQAKFGGALVLLKPAPKGSGLIAGGSPRAILALSGISDVSVKMLGNNNKINNAYAVVKALKQLSKTVGN